MIYSRFSVFFSFIHSISQIQILVIRNFKSYVQFNLNESAAFRNLTDNLNKFHSLRKYRNMKETILSANKNRKKYTKFVYCQLIYKTKSDFSYIIYNSRTAVPILMVSDLFDSAPLRIVELLK